MSNSMSNKNSFTIIGLLVIVAVFAFVFSAVFGQLERRGPSAIVSNYAYVFNYAQDNAGNSGISGVVPFMVDRDPPLCQIVSPEAHSWQNRDFEVEVEDDDGFYGSGIDPQECKYKVGDAGLEARSCNSPFTVTVGPAGECAQEGVDTCPVSVFCQDILGHQGSDSKVFSIGREFEPNVPRVSPLPVYQGDYCQAPLRPSFFWVFEDPGDSQAGYQVQVDNNAAFSSPEIDSGPTLSASQAYTHNYPDDLAYNTAYYWRIRVWDTNDGFVSDWAQGDSFTTSKHKWPEPYFTWRPQAPSLNQQIQFCAVWQDTVEEDTCSEILQEQESICYNNQNLPISCAQAGFSWDFADGAVSDLANPVHIYSQASEQGYYTVELIITDQDGYACVFEDDVKIYLRPPEWEEIPPF